MPWEATTRRICLTSRYRSRSAETATAEPSQSARNDFRRPGARSYQWAQKDSLDSPTKPKRTVTCPRALPRCMCPCLREMAPLPRLELLFITSSLPHLLRRGRQGILYRPVQPLWCSSRCFAEDCTPRPNNRTVRISTISWPEKLKRSMRKAARPSIHAPAH
jgi:hypothetical protein